MSVEHVIAIDLGGTKLASAIIDNTGQVAHRTRVPAKHSDFAATVIQLEDAVTQAAKQAPAEQPRAVSVLIPGIYFPDTGYAWAPNLWGDCHVTLKTALEARLRLPVVIDNDRVGCVVGEQWQGVAQGLRDVVFLTVGTGIGAGIISGGRLLRGSNGIAGAVGWFALNSDMQDLYRSIGCWEAESAGPALARRAQFSCAEEVVAAARKSDPAARAAVQRAATYLGMGIANIVSLLNPQMIVLGGGLMQAADLFLETITRVMLDWAQPIAARQVHIALTTLGEDAGLLGAARLAFDYLGVSVSGASPWPAASQTTCSTIKTTP